MAPRSLSVRIVGADYPNSDKSNRRFELMLCEPGDLLELRPEPKNPADENAIAVFSVRGIQIGYIASDRAAWLTACMHRGSQLAAAFQARAPWGAVARIGIDGDSLDLPPDDIEPPPEDDWEHRHFIPPDD